MKGNEMNILKNIFKGSLYLIGAAFAVAFSAGIVKGAYDEVKKPSTK